MLFNRGAPKNVRGAPLRKGTQGCTTSLPTIYAKPFKKIVNKTEPRLDEMTGTISLKLDKHILLLQGNY